MPPSDRIRRAGAWLAGARAVGPGAGPHSPRPLPLAAPRAVEAPDATLPDTAPGGLGSVSTDPTERLPDGLAELRVQRVRGGDGDPAYLLTGVCGGPSDDLPFTSRAPELAPTDINLERVREGGAMPSEFYREVRHWSFRQRPLVGWLNAQRDRHGAALHLVVWDDTDYEIPWEMLLLNAEAATTGTDLPLGAAVPVARWTTIRELARPLLDEPAHCSGRVLSYFDEPNRSDAGAFSPFDHESHTDVDRFLDRLDERRRAAEPVPAAGGPGAASRAAQQVPGSAGAAGTSGRPDTAARPDTGGRPDPCGPGRADTGLGLVYMGCHGTHGKRIDDLTVGMLTWYELDEPAMSALHGDTGTGGTLVCLNVCHSGRLVDNRGGGEDALRGFSELFLRKGAKACIATRGEVGETEARALLGHLVEHAHRTPDRPIAQMLRDFRAHAVASLPHRVPRVRASDGGHDVDGQRRVLDLLYAFMYVYYGHPLTTLQLAPHHPDPAP
ncbi:hypothetical protein SAMN05216223_102314 [Actinacidiphila yanglinensis]|uniref:CHAT domain-containing protein n=1 Tax=Actinacidiphila yanglinensis TaxID=310779 RepID=A0A1H5VI64_9ACTN|nr:CHAT domain-containing protein [Actinacidiphila yanglinensis]SEF87055.1 hypothetical protein SAMN05216223_102314 [Actinacidiphila yanglinensis]